MTKQSKAAETRTPSREPIEVDLLKFPADGVFDGPGVSVTSTCRSRKSGNHKGARHEIVYMPWIRHFQVTYYPPTGESQRVYVHESLPSYWVPL